MGLQVHNSSFGFKDSFMKWVHTLYSQISCKITNNGWLSSKLHISRGIRQGCPLSALLFVITVKTMAAPFATRGVHPWIKILQYTG